MQRNKNVVKWKFIKIAIMLIVSLALMSCGNVDVQELTDKMDEYEEIYEQSNEKIVFEKRLSWSYSDGATYWVICDGDQEYILRNEPDKIILVPIEED